MPGQTGLNRKPPASQVSGKGLHGFGFGPVARPSRGTTLGMVADKFMWKIEPAGGRFQKEKAPANIPPAPKCDFN